MEKDIYNFHQQLLANFEVVNEKKWHLQKHYILSGMGGSRLPADILKALLPEFPLFVHNNYSLPALVNKNSGFIGASYSGNTEEVLDSLKAAIFCKLPVLLISKGGKLLETAEAENFPFIQLPQNDVQPRLALGYSFKALTKGLNLKEQEAQCSLVSKKIMKRRDALQDAGKKLAALLEEKVPIIYADAQNEVLARIFKINFNETTKIPSFYNILPELNHNEMTGFDAKPINKHLSSNMIFIFLRDKSDEKKNKKRFDVLKTLFQKREMQILEVDVEGTSRMEKIFSAVILSAWTSYYLSFYYKTEPSLVPMVEEFKELIK